MYGKRGAKRYVADVRIMVEGELVLVGDIATRLGVSKATVTRRLRWVRDNHPAVTWELLRTGGNSR